MEKIPHYHISWIVSFQKRIYYTCDMLPLETKLSGGKLPPDRVSRGWGSVSGGNMQALRRAEGTYSYKTVRTLNQGGKLKNLKTEMQKNDLPVLRVSEVRWKGQGEIRSGDYTVYYSGGERAERGVAIVVHKSIMRSVVKKIVCNDKIITLKLTLCGP
jgi:nitrogen regulatory protein PII